MITLLTDFGLEDIYIGVMKGVILGIAPQVPIIDLTHNIPAQDLSSAGFQLACAHPYFPHGTIHTAVVDPGVGSAREAIAIQTESSYLVGPNNGLFSLTLEQSPLQKIVALDNPRFWLSPNPSQTFHGRDIFAPVAAHLANGEAIENLGSPLPFQNLIQIQSKSFSAETNPTGHIQAIDHFGNLITTFPANLVKVQDAKNWHLKIQGTSVRGHLNYSEVSIGEAIALIGSHGYLEIAINQGNAQRFFQVSVNEPVQLLRDQS